MGRQLMGRRASAFAAQLDDLDDLDNLPGLPASAEALPPGQAAARKDAVATSAKPQPDRLRTRAPQPVAKPPAGGTRATQVRLPPDLARWLSEQAHSTGRTLASVVALAAKAHQDALPLAPGQPDQLDVSRRTASATVPVTLRLNGAQRQLLDDLAGQHTTTRSAVIVAALTASRPARAELGTEPERPRG